MSKVAPGGPEGHRLCVSASHGKGLKKTTLQGAFGEFGRILQIETPKPNLAFIAFEEKRDAEDAIESMDGRNLDGQTITVSKAGPKPTYRPTADPNENFKQVLMTTKTERENVRYNNDVEKAAEKLRPKSRSRSIRKRRARSQSRSPPKRRKSSRSRGARHKSDRRDSRSVRPSRRKARNASRSRSASPRRRRSRS
mmetsp:Transcript_58682/g.137406  ORF Transcript_58682/g.137406 Transcript_58682/m.137406 type:complete len:196 (+) Transcript_58682:63-650(+)